MRLRFTLTSRGELGTETIEINEPDGWKDTILKLARDKDFRSLIEFFDGSFIFYGDNGSVNGGIEFIKQYDRLYGPDANIEMLIELTLNDVDYETVFSGQLDLSLAEEMPDNKIRVPIIRDNFWAKFYSRKDTPVDLHATSDLDEETIEEPIGTINLLLPSQIITYYTEYHAKHSITYVDDLDPTEDDSKLMLNWDRVVQDDIKLFSIARAAVSTEIYSILGLFEAPYDGVYTIELVVPVAEYDAPDWTADTTNRIRIKKTNSNSQDIYAFPDHATIITSGADNLLLYQFSVDYTLLRGEQLVIAINRAAGDVTVFGEERLNWKADCDLATTQEITLSGEQTIDGVLTATSRVLVKNQSNQAENGIYDTSAGAWTRATDLDSAGEAYLAAVYITSGDFQADTAWLQPREVGTLGVDPLPWELTDPSDERKKQFPGDYTFENYIKITAKTKFPASEQPASLLHDAAAAILKSYGLGETNPFYSELLGSSYTLARQYDQDGCAWRYAILRGLQLRGYSLEDKPFFLSFNEWWKGANPILNLGLTYETLEGYTIDPSEISIQDLVDWANAGGTFPGAWDYSLGFPTTSVNGNGGTEGYTRGNMATVAGQTYVISVVSEIYESGTNPVDITLIFALLDSSDNELDTVEFNYTSHGFKVEIFLLTPASNGTRFGLRVVNDTAFDTKTLSLRLAVGDTTEQLLLNEDFLDASVWTNEGAGTDWTVGSEEATIALAAGDSKALTQEFAGGEAGDYYFISEFTAENFSGGDSADLTVNFYDEDDNLLSTNTEVISSNQTLPWGWNFTSIVAVAKVEIILSLTGGSDVNVTLTFAGLFILVATPQVTVPSQQVIRVEEVEYFYDRDTSLNISNIRNITRKYDNDKIYNKINIGYNTWRSEDISGIDDTQTQHIYATKFEKIGETITLWSDFIAASLAIESTRRKTIAESTDYKFDDSTFIIAINPDDVSPDTYSPELSENFTDIENLLDPELRYNTRITPARNLLRWRKWFNGCLQNLLTSFYKFVRGEGNFDMASTMLPSSPDCLDESFDSEPLSEKQNIPVTSDYIHLPNYYEFETPMDWEDYQIIRNNRTKAIGISLSDLNHTPLFIDQLDYSIMHGMAKITGWTTEYLDISVVEDAAAEQICLPTTSCEDAITDELGDMLTNEFGACITAS